MNKKIKSIILTILAAAVIILGSFFCINSVVFADTASAAEADTIETISGTENTPTEPPIGEDEQTPSDDTEGAEGLAVDFVEWLKSEYGEDYEYYYNLIIEKWGSIEAYLLQFGEENLTPEMNEWWNEAISLVGQYSFIWAPVLAVILLVAALLIGKSMLAKIIDKAVNVRVEAIQNTQSAQSEELNRQSAAICSLGDGLRGLLGTGEKFSAEREEIQKSTEELKNG